VDEGEQRICIANSADNRREKNYGKSLLNTPLLYVYMYGQLVVHTHDVNRVPQAGLDIHFITSFDYYNHSTASYRAGCRETAG
jgi:hypothetical protein